jgi:hypothetical protein
MIAIQDTVMKIVPLIESSIFFSLNDKNRSLLIISAPYFARR